MKITITIPETTKARVIKGFCSQQGYAEILDNGEANPETKKQFFHRKIQEFIVNSILKDETEIAKNAAADTVRKSVTTEIQIDVTSE